MENIVKGKNDNFGSIAEVFFVPMAVVKNFPDPDANGLIRMYLVTLETGELFNRFSFTIETAEFSEQQVVKDGNVFWKQKLEMWVSKDHYGAWAAFSEMEYHNFLVFCRDNNNVCKVMGYINKDLEKVGPTLTVGQTTNKKWVGANGHQATFEFESKSKARHVYAFFGIYQRAKADPSTVEVPLESDDTPPED